MASLFSNNSLTSTLRHKLITLGRCYMRNLSTKQQRVTVLSCRGDNMLGPY